MKPGDEVVLHQHRPMHGWDGVGTEAEGYLLGLLVGDGVLKADKAVLSVWERASSPSGAMALQCMRSVAPMVSSQRRKQPPARYPTVPTSAAFSAPWQTVAKCGMASGPLA